MGRAVSRKREPQRFLGAGLADRAGDRDHLRLRARTRRGGERAQAGEYVGHHQQRRIVRQRRLPAGGDDGERCPRAKRRGDEFMAVAAVGDGEERFAGTRWCGCRWKSPRYRTAAHRGVRRPSPPPCRRRSTAQRAVMRQLPERRGDRLVIAERHHPVADDLAGFMALAGDQQNVARAQRGDRRTDRLAPVADLDGARRRGQDGGADGRGDFAARIVVGDDDAIGLRGSDRAHQRPLAAVAVAAGTEYHHELAAHRGPQRLERLGERVGLMRIVDEDRRAVARSGQFEPALCAFEIFERREYRSGIVAGRDGEPGGDQRVLDLKLADQRQPHLKLPAGMRQKQRLRKALGRGFDQTNSAAVAPDADHRKPPRVCRLHNSFGVLMIDIDDGCRRPARAALRTASAWPRNTPRSRDDSRDDRA